MRDIVGLYLNPPDHAVVLSDRPSRAGQLHHLVAKLGRVRQVGSWHRGFSFPEAKGFGIHQSGSTPVRAWLARRPRYHIHYTPTYASWLNQVERWFAIITQMAIRRGSFSNVSDLVNKIELFVQHYNAKATSLHVDRNR